MSLLRDLNIWNPVAVVFIRLIVMFSNISKDYSSKLTWNGAMDELQTSRNSMEISTLNETSNLLHIRKYKAHISEIYNLGGIKAFKNNTHKGQYCQ